MPLVRSRFRRDVEDGSARASQLRAIGICRDPKLLDDFVAELVGRAIAASSLREERVVVVRSVDQEAVLKATHAANRQVAIGIGGKTARILGHIRGQQREIGKAPAVEREVLDRALRYHIGYVSRLRFHRDRCGGNGNGLGGSGRSQAELHHRNSSDQQLHSTTGSGGHAGADAVTS